VISGVGVAAGYLEEEERTHASCRDDPLSPGQRVYCTGDLARMETDGQLVHLGRIDRQVKVRGTRVEPEALEAAARATGLCADARVKSYRLPASPDTQLVLFAEGCPDTDALRRALRGRIPAAAWPHHIAAVDALPRRASGKTADELLPADYAHALSRSRATIPRGTGTLSRIWATVLGAPPRPADRFFDMGGDSLNVLRLVRLVREAGIDLDSADVYAHPEFSDLDRLCRARRRRARAVPTGIVTGQIPLGPAQEWLLAMAPPDPRPWIQQHVISF